jgi:transglutaminase-like putative cysteine protease
MGNKTPILLFLNTLNLYTHQYINYTQGATSVHTTANDIFNFPKGVCQDYAHLFIAVCRYNGIPARYVSGYIFPDDQLLGALQMHAWVEAFVPDIGWIGIDPTNNIFTDTNFIKVSHGTDYNDCSPIKGILNTSGNNTTVHDVHVELNTMNQQQQQQQQ